MPRHNAVFSAIAALATCAGAATLARAGDNTHTFNFANVGQSYSAAIFGSSPLVGRRVTERMRRCQICHDVPPARPPGV